MGLTAIAALVLHTPFPFWQRAGVATLLLILVLRQLQRYRSHRPLLSHDSQRHWTLKHHATAVSRSGRLVSSGYRSSLLLVIVIQTDNRQLHSLPLWRDQVSGQQFSYLHQQLAYASEPHSRRTFLTWLRDQAG